MYFRMNFEEKTFQIHDNKKNKWKIWHSLSAVNLKQIVPIFRKILTLQLVDLALIWATFLKKMNITLKLRLFKMVSSKVNTQ